MKRIRISLIAAAAIIMVSSAMSFSSRDGAAARNRGGITPRVGQMAMCEKLMTKSTAIGIGCLVLRYGVGGVSDMIEAIVLQWIVKDMDAVFRSLNSAPEDGSRSAASASEETPSQQPE